MSSREPSAFEFPPGTDPHRRRPRLSFELLGCAWNGHALVGTDAATVRDEDSLVVRELDAHRRLHRCLRCDAWTMLPVPAHPARPAPASRDEIVLPDRGRPLKSRYVLRLIAVTRAFNVLVLLLVLAGAVAVLANRTSLRDDLVANASSLQTVFGGQAIGQVQSVLTGGAGPLWLVAVGLTVLVALEATEGVGLWRATRWGEYLTFVMTTLLLVPEVLELTSSTSPGTIVGMVVNVAVVLYLLLSKRLFGLRGGAAAVAAEREHDISWTALARHIPERPALDPGPGSRISVPA